ncbi:DeoR/GlpR family DNA-binding transcription regulator [Candidatus Arthromitus sp. SFB-rat-Yit]|uniref:DeoR/GlpR family DNA-binding transcription regulator n=1 Tax=Candidatus Arthromitus sp. SFB-rat-Yit TaxID=1041504 RepID=UPI0035237C57
MSILKISKKIINTRRGKILMEIQTSDKVFVNTLSKKLKVSPLTIRRDLQVLEDNGFIERFYGGAKFKNKNLYIKERKDYIDSIAKIASNYVEDNDIIFVNTSKITLKMLEYIHNKNVNVITNNANAILINNPNISVILTGGDLNTNKKSLTGELAVRTLNNIIATKCFLGCSGITTNGFTSIIPQEACVNECMIKRCIGNVFILAETSKIGRECNFLSGTINMINTLITDSSPSDELINIQKKGIKIIYSH